MLFEYKPTLLRKRCFHYLDSSSTKSMFGQKWRAAYKGTQTQFQEREKPSQLGKQKLKGFTSHKMALWKLVRSQNTGWGGGYSKKNVRRFQAKHVLTMETTGRYNTLLIHKSDAPYAVLKHLLKQWNGKIVLIGSCFGEEAIGSKEMHWWDYPCIPPV